MANQVIHGIVWAADFKSFRCLGDSAAYAFQYDGPPPIQAKDLDSESTKVINALKDPENPVPLTQDAPYHNKDS